MVPLKRRVIIEKYILRKTKIRRYFTDVPDTYFIDKHYKTCPFQEDDDVFVKIIRPVEYEKRKER